MRKLFVLQLFNEIYSYTINMSFRVNLRELRKEKELTQTALAQLLCTTQDTISLWELGKSYPDIPALIELTKIFEVTSDYLSDLEK